MGLIPKPLRFLCSRKREVLRTNVPEGVLLRTFL
jgi:hypothetical protein